MATSGAPSREEIRSRKRAMQIDLDQGATGLSAKEMRFHFATARPMTTVTVLETPDLEKVVLTSPQLEAILQQGFTELGSKFLESPVQLRLTPVGAADPVRAQLRGPAPVSTAATSPRTSAAGTWASPQTSAAGTWASPRASVALRFSVAPHAPVGPQASGALRFSVVPQAPIIPQALTAPQAALTAFAGAVHVLRPQASAFQEISNVRQPARRMVEPSRVVPAGAPGPSSTNPTDPSSFDRLQDKRARNRIAAAKCRQKKLDLIAELRESIARHTSGTPSTLQTCATASTHAGGLDSSDSDASSEPSGGPSTSGEPPSVAGPSNATPAQSSQNARRRSANLTTPEKLEDRRARNRIAAAKCRKKKLDLIASLQHQKALLERGQSVSSMEGNESQD
ncbi:transcription factor AP-1-like [Galendromus occidentalis]|uniref:Transcription factor AP-1-like n=1 Tax=Galendromus occidentalis TaxID=34638 RepID=A0AAJ7L5Y8_9ACAR|nr:transcription factor AP-1-like [Galendromus occidentalis]